MHKTDAALQEGLQGYITLTQAQRIKPFSIQTWRTYADTGRVRSVRAGGRRLLHRGDVERLAGTR